MSASNLPPLRLETCHVERREPGLMLFNVRPAGRDRDVSKHGWVIGIDQGGAVILNVALDAPTQDVRLHPDGTIIFNQPGIGLINQIDFSGRFLQCWHIAGLWREAPPPPGSSAIELPLISHTVDILPDGALLLVSAECRTFEDWPGSENHPDAPIERAKVVGGVIVEVAPDGTIRRKLSLLDILDPYRICYGSRRGHWSRRGFPDSRDWCHVNCAAYQAEDDSILVSLRNQDCIVKIDRETGELKWILGPPGNWRNPWADKLLTPVGDLQWQYHQHDCSVTREGTVMCFDNGNHRALPFEPPMAGEDSHSRAVEFAVDEAAGRVRQVWAFGDRPEDRLFSCFQGGARRLPETGNTFVTFGGVCTINGRPTADNVKGLNRARLVEVTPEGDVVFDLWVDGSRDEVPHSYSVFRAEHRAEA